MKKVAVCLLVFVGWLLAGGDIPVDELPSVVVKALEKKFPGIEIEEADIDKFDPVGNPRKVLTYELKCVLGMEEIEVLVTEKGEVLDEEFERKRRNPFRNAPRWAAFTGIRWDGDQPSVEVDGEWYELVAFHGVPTTLIVDYCDKNVSDPRRRFNEDLVVVLRLMGHEIGRDAVLKLRTAAGETIEKKIRMTDANRRELMRSLRAELRTERFDARRKLSKAEVEKELKAFRAGLEERFAYLEANGVDLDRTLNPLRREMTAGQLAWALQFVMAKFIDGHAGVRPLGTGGRDSLPLLIEPTGDRFVAFRADRSGFVVDGYPYVEEIDGKKIDWWIGKLEALSAKGSEQHRTRHALRWLRHLPFARGIAGLEERDTVSVTLASEKGKRKAVKLPLSDRFPIYGTWPRRGSSRVLDGNIGYLRLAKMDDAAVHAVRRWMPKFAGTKGLVVDVRGNGGGSRSALLALYPWLMSPGEEPRIVSVAKYRLFREYRENHLAARFMVPGEPPAGFKPEWEPPADKFSKWHILRIEKRDSGTYEKAVVVLMDNKCFSATDIFLGALKGRKNVTLVGMPSGGGSAFRQRFVLPESGLEVSCASMASFQRDGKLYDGNGIFPDVVVDPAPEYFLSGGPDVVLERALTLLRR